MRTSAPVVFLLLVIPIGCAESPADTPVAAPALEIQLLEARLEKLIADSDREEGIRNVMQACAQATMARTWRSSSPVTLGSLVTREHETEITCGPDGPTFTVKSRDGTVIVEDIPLPELAAEYPDVFMSFQGMCTGNLWAGVQREPPEIFTDLERTR